MSKSTSDNRSTATPFENLVAGAGSGFLTRCVVAPMDVIKVRFQLQTNRGQFYRSIPHALYRIARDEGPAALWKGNLIATIMSSPYTGIAMVTHKGMKKYAFGDSNSSLSYAVSGATAGIVATGLTYPCDLLRSRFIAQQGKNGYTSIYNAVTTIYRHQGIKGIFEGISPALVGIVPYMAVQFLVYESLSEYFAKNASTIGNWSKQMIESIRNHSGLGLVPEEHKEHFVKWSGLDTISQSALTDTENNAAPVNGSTAGTISSSSSSIGLDQKDDVTTSSVHPSSDSPKKEISSSESSSTRSAPMWAVPIVGFASGTAGKAVSFPMDLIKRRIQMNSFSHAFDQRARPDTTSIIKVAQTVWQREGFFAFYKGLIPALLKSGPSASLVFVFYEGILRLMRAAKDNGMESRVVTPSGKLD